MPAAQLDPHCPFSKAETPFECPNCRNDETYDAVERKCYKCGYHWPVPGRIMTLLEQLWSK